MDIFLMYLKVFFVGGTICTIAQVLINYTKITAGKILVCFLLAGVFLQAIGLYQYLVDFAGAGATVPLTGFGHALAQGVKHAVEESGVIGAFTGGLSATAGGITAAILFGTLVALLFKPHAK